MKRVNPRRMVCAVWLLLGWGLVVPALGGDWLDSVADPKPPRFRAARYQGDSPQPAIDTPEPAAAPAIMPGSRLLRDPQAEPVPAPQADQGGYFGEGYLLDELSDADPNYSGLGAEFPEFFHRGGGQFIAGAEYLNARPTFSEATAYAQIDSFTTNSRQTLVQYDFGYQATPRVYLGYRWPNCCSEVRFTYTQLQGNANVASGPTVGDQVFILDPDLPVCSCTEIVAQASVNANLYDIDFGKCQCLQSQPCCPQTCGTPCARPCNKWDVQYWVGLRVANIGWQAQGQVIDIDTQDLEAQDNHRMTFNGAGPRVGINLRRYFGMTGRLSMYGRANIALILGHYQIVTTQTEFDGVDVDVDTNTLSRDRIIPMTEIEVGLSYNIRQRTTISAGYFFQAWHDLGMSQQVSGQFPPYDDANILSFDGLFVRGEWAF